MGSECPTIGEKIDQAWESLWKEVSEDIRRIEALQEDVNDG